jgi:hypothetical protein
VSEIDEVDRDRRILRIVDRPRRGRRAEVARLIRWTVGLFVVVGLVAALVCRSWVAAQARALIVLSRTSNTPVVGWLVSVVTDEPRAEETRIAGQPTTLARPGAGRSWRSCSSTA